MSGRSANESISAAKSTIHSLRSGENSAGISGTDTSAIGGEGRKGADGYGSLEMAPTKSITSLAGGGSGKAKKGEMGVGYGEGETF
jgi:hypothetical protein